MIQTNLPQESGTYKVVQLEMDSQQHLRFDEWSGHGMILTSLLEKEGDRIGSYDRCGLYKMSSGQPATQEQMDKCLRYETVPDLCDSDFEVPALRGEGYRVLGMGKARVNAKDKSIEFFGRSMSYGIRPNLEQLTQLQKEKTEWRIKK